MLSATFFKESISIGFRIKATLYSPESTFDLISKRGIVPSRKVMFLSVFSSVIPKIGDKIFSDKIEGSKLSNVKLYFLE